MPTFEITAPDGKVYDVTGANEQGALAALQAQLSQTQLPTAQTQANVSTSDTSAQAPAQDINGPMQGFGAAFRSGIDAPLENMAETAEAVGATGTSETLSNLTDAPENYESASGRFIEGDEDGSYAYRYLPKAAVEQVGQYAGSLLTRAAGATVGGAVAGPVGAAVGAFSGPFAFEAVQLLGPIANERARNNGRDKPNKDDFMAAASSAAASGALNALIPGKAGIIKRTGAETVTEGAQSVVEQTGSTAGTDVGLQIDPRQAIGEGIIGGTSAGGVNTLVTTVRKTGEVVLGNPKDLDPETSQAAGDVARMLQDFSKNNKLKLKNIDATSVKGANQSLEMARSKIREEVDVAQDVIRREFDLKNAPPEITAQFNAAIKQSNNKVSSIVSIENINFIKDNFGQSEVGQSLVNAFRKSNVATELTNAGLKGGISQFTDQFNPLPSFGRAFNPAGGVAGNLNAGAAVLTGGQSLAFQIPAMVGGRAIDAITGRRSKVARFVKKNKNKAGLGAVDGVDVRGMAKARKDLEYQKNQQANLKIKAAVKNKAQRIKDEANVSQSAIWADDFKRGSDPTINSPRFSAHDRYRDVYSRMGLSPKILAKDIDAEIFTTIDQLLSDLSKDTNPTSKRLAEDLIDYKMAINGGREVRNLNSVIGAVATKMMENSGITQGQVNTGAPNVTNAAPRPLTPRQEGIASNRQLNQELVDAVKNSKVSGANKIKLLNALKALSLNFGQGDSVASAKAIIDKETAGVPKATVDKYINPYLERVTLQQAAAKEKAAAKAQGKKSKK